jgi:hypothetical protein
MQFVPSIDLHIFLCPCNATGSGNFDISDTFTGRKFYCAQMKVGEPSGLELREPEEKLVDFSGG